MGNTYSQIYIQVVFAVRNRDAMIMDEWASRLYDYITAIVQNKHQKMLAINGMPDHLHFFIGMQPDCCLSELVREIKKNTNDFINDNKLTRSRFYWQDGFGAFSYSRSHIDNVVKYIKNQKEHHLRQNFKDEYLEFLRKFSIEYNEKFLFDWIQ
ncbi:MAG TPA: IS200/IS605 family transposase [Lentimicrobium sp.]|nr:IS200/IS605 family transposase [Lentimicrobium sp.]